MLLTPTADVKKYWLGETFEDLFNELISAHTNIYAFTCPSCFRNCSLSSRSSDDAQPAKSPSYFSRCFHRSPYIFQQT